MMYANAPQVHSPCLPSISSRRPLCLSVHGNHRNFADAKNPRNRLRVVCATKTEADTVPEIEGVDRDYCDEFVCRSSPSVEQTVKAFAFDVERAGQWTLVRFADDVEYKDAFRSFKGRDKYERFLWVSRTLTKPKGTVKRLRMLDKYTAVVDWKLTGQLAQFPVDVDFKSTITMNLLTGRITSHRDEWDLSKTPFPQSLLFTASRAAWSLGQSTEDSKEWLKSMSDKLSDKLSGGDDADDIYRDPTDPTKYYQNKDTTMQDAFAYATVVAFLYALYQAYMTIFNLKQ